jgi:hypothetical protein
MSDQGIDAAIAKIMSDPAYAKTVFQNPEEALSAPFNLLPGEWRTISICLNQDVQESLGNVQPTEVAKVDFSKVKWNLIKEALKFKSSFERFSYTPTSTPGRGQFNR